MRVFIFVTDNRYSGESLNMKIPRLMQAIFMLIFQHMCTGISLNCSFFASEFVLTQTMI